MHIETAGVVSEAFTGDTAKLDTVIKRIAIKGATIQKMKKISSIFSDEIGSDLKETELIASFLEISFDAFLRSGEIEKRIKTLTGDL